MRYPFATRGSSLTASTSAMNAPKRSTAAHELAERAAELPIPKMADAFMAMADDEARHAALAFDTGEWLSEKSPALRQHAQREVERFLASSSKNERVKVEPLLTAMGLTPA